ncbi:MAG: AMP-binding protein, partial [Shimia sp.]
MANPLYDVLYTPHVDNAAPFLIPDAGPPVSFADLIAEAHRIAGAFDRIGVSRGDRVALHVAKSPTAVAVVAACAIAGLVLLPLNPAYTADELGYYIGDAEPALLIQDPGHPYTPPPGVRRLTLDAAGGGSLRDQAQGAPSLPAVASGDDDLAAILYTSGTTGRPKGAMLSHGNLVSNALTLTELWRFTARDRLLHALPIFHTHGLFVALNVALCAGAAVRFHARFGPNALVADMPEATALMGVPTFYTRLLAESGLAGATRGMRLFISGSAPLSADTHAAWRKATGHEILERYGMTELNMATSNPYDGPRVPGSVGVALPGVSLHVASQRAGEPGILHVKGPNVFQGYWRNPEKTAEELSPDGWFDTGDIATLDAEGYVRIVGRA